LVNQPLKAAAGIDFNTFIDRLGLDDPALMFAIRQLNFDGQLPGLLLSFPEIFLFDCGRCQS
jgi:hypothetical protein